MKVQVDIRRVREKIARLDAEETRAVTGVVKQYGEKAYSEIKTLLNRPVAKRRGVLVARSRPGQPPRTDSGRMLRSIRFKVSPKGWRAEVSTGDEAQDSEGRRYPWMLEAGTNRIKKRPLFARVKRKLLRPFRRDMALAVFGVARRVNRS